MKRVVLVTTFVAFVATVYGANWALATFGVVSFGFGLAGPAGVYFAGLAFGLRDVLHELGGVRVVLAAIVAGATLSYIIEDGVTVPGGLVPIAVASAAAFGLSELFDLFVYKPLRERHWVKAVVASNVVGSVTDSVVFLVLAFGSLQFVVGQTVGKTFMVIVALPLVWLTRRGLRSVVAASPR